MAENSIYYFILPAVIIIGISLILSSVLQPFIDDGIPTPYETSPFLQFMINAYTSEYIIENVTIAIPFAPNPEIDIPNFYRWLMPNSVMDYVGEKVITLSYLPTWLQTPLIIILMMSILLALVSIVTQFIS